MDNNMFIYRPKCGNSCPLYPRMCLKHPNELYCTIELSMEDGLIVVNKHFFTLCSICPEKGEIPVDPKDLPEGFIHEIPIRQPDEE